MNAPKINQLPFMQIVKESRAYILLLPFNAPFDEAHDVMLEFAKDVRTEQEFRNGLIEKAKLDQEQQNAKAEASAEAAG
jgi:hypothetical protein